GHEGGRQADRRSRRPDSAIREARRREGSQRGRAMSTGRLAGKTALITGAAMGIGAAVASKFREEGAAVFICDTNRVEGEKTAASIGGVFIPLDVTSEESWTAAYAVVMEQAKHLDILVNNAGI